MQVIELLIELEMVSRLNLVKGGWGWDGYEKVLETVKLQLPLLGACGPKLWLQ